MGPTCLIAVLTDSPNHLCQNLWMCIFFKSNQKTWWFIFKYVCILLYRVWKIHSGCCIVFDVLLIAVLFFPYFVQTIGCQLLCFGWISISFGKPFLIWMPQTWSGSLWCQKWDSNTGAQWLALSSTVGRVPRFTLKDPLSQNDRSQPYT